MTAAVIEIEQLEEKETSMLQQTARKAMLVSLGAFGLAQDNLFKLVDKLVERGEQVTNERRAQVEEIVEERKKDAQKASKEAEKRLEKRAASILHTLNIPTREDVRSLNTKITTLSRKVDELKKVNA